jgi:hypothetical protein
MSDQFKNLIGQRFGRLLITEKTQKRSQRSIVWRCLCACGNETFVSTGNLQKKRNLNMDMQGKQERQKNIILGYQ